MKLAQKTAIALMRIRLRLLQLISPARAGQAAFELFCTPMGDRRREPDAFFRAAQQLAHQFRDYELKGYRWPGTGERRALVIHGFHSTVLNFGQYIRGLQQAGYQVVAFDAPAHGRSSGNRINALIYRDFLLDLFERYGSFEVCLAHSFGGLSLSLAIAELPADKQPARVALIAPATSSRTAMNQFFGLLSLNPSVYTPLFEQRIRELSGQTPEWFSVTRAFPLIRSGVFWIHDEQDSITPFRDTEAVRQANYPNLRFVSTSGLGHRRIYQDPETAARILDFLTENPLHAEPVS